MVNSISWGSYEEDYAQSNLDSFNNEAVALVNMGVTILVSSGDDGVSGSGCDCTEDSSSATLTSMYTPQDGASWTGQGYFPSFPATNPYGECPPARLPNLIAMNELMFFIYFFVFVSIGLNLCWLCWLCWLCSHCGWCHLWASER
jgi:hypothetical protein